MVPVSRLVGRIAGMQPYLATAPASPRDAVAGHPRVVAAGGLAGASAAVVLAQRGMPVVICEAARQLGGRLGAHLRTHADGRVQWIDHGFHGFFRRYYNWRLIILALTLRSPSLRLRELVRADHTVGLSLAGFDAEQTYAHLEQVSAEQLLAALRLAERARVMLCNVFAHSFFNDARSKSAAGLMAMFHFFFLANPEGLGMDVPHAGYQNAIWAPLGRCLEQRGARIQTRTPVTAIDRDPDGHRRVRTAAGATLTADEVVLATDAAAAARILTASPCATSGDSRLATGIGAANTILTAWRTAPSRCGPWRRGASWPAGGPRQCAGNRTAGPRTVKGTLWMPGSICWYSGCASR
jgi:carotenoid phi-ring synthase / carotenoid chi-ring synthase